MSKWRKQVKKLQGAVKRWRKQWLRDGKQIEKLCAQINDLTSREAAALNQAEQYRRQALEIDKKAKGDLRVKEDEVRRMRESRDAWTRSYNESRILRDQAVAEMNRGGKDGRNLGKFGIGLNPRARPKGQIVEAQKALGAVHIAFGGSAPFGGKVDCDVRVDGIMTEATVEIDGNPLMEKGRLPT